MKRLLLLFGVVLLVSCFPRPWATCINFEAPLAAPTQYGAPTGLAAGAVAFTSMGVPLTLRDFTWMNGGTAFHYVQIDTMAVAGGSGQSLRLNNINAEFDFGSLGGVNAATFVFTDLGGNENVSINGSAPHVGEITALPATLGGVNVTVTSTPVAGGRTGRVTLNGPVRTLSIGGQELWIDDVCVRP